MKLHTFQELISRIVHLSTRDGRPIPITFSGTDAYTNAKSVNLPTLPAGTILTPHQFSIWMGYTIHEGPGHQTHTDLNLYTHTCQQRHSPQFSYILNLLEDIRIENADLTIYPGDRKYLDTVRQFVDDKIPPHMAQNPDTMGLIYKHLFVHHRNLDTNRISGNLDPHTARLVSQIDTCHSTQDCIYLADRIVSHLKQNQEEEKQEENNKNNTSDDNQSNNNQSTTPSAARDATTDGEKDQQGDNNENRERNDKETQSKTSGNRDNDDLGNESENESKSKPKGNQENSNKGEKGSNFSYSSDQSASTASASTWQELTEIKNIINELKNQTEAIGAPAPLDLNLDGKSIFPPANILNDRIYVPSREDLPTYNFTRAECSAQILALKKMFRIYLQAKTTKSQLRGLEEGKLDTQRLHLPATGQTTIFKDQHLKMLPFTAIELMIDLSGSMDANIARTAAIILAESLNSIPQIKLSISGFTTKHNRYDHHNPPPNSGRQNSMDILNFKDFTTPYTKCKAKLGAINNNGLTPLGDAYGHALEHLISRPEPRRIIFLITDGKPEFTHGKNHSDYLLMQKIHHTASRYQIQTLGLGIGNNLEFLTNYFDRVINISQTSTLPKNLLEALKFFI